MKRNSINDVEAKSNDSDFKPKRKKVSSACLYCRRSHMTCDESRPCKRCIKRNIAHLCHDPPPKEKSQKLSSLNNNQQSHHNVVNGNSGISSSSNNSNNINPNLIDLNCQLPFNNLDLEFQNLNDFINHFNLYFNDINSQSNLNSTFTSNNSIPSPIHTPTYINNDESNKYYLTAANPPITIDRDQRLKCVISAKQQAGLLKPFNYRDGYARLNSHLDLNVSLKNKMKILKDLSKIRPSFKSIAQLQSEWELTFVEELFERLLLEYDRVFSTFNLPSCCWRRTGEIYKANNEFSQLVGRDIDSLKDGILAIQDLLDEESLVNYWNKYSMLAFNHNSKGVLTSCTLRKQLDNNQVIDIPCNFSFMIRRDNRGMPLMIIGNFMKLS